MTLPTLFAIQQVYECAAHYTIQRHRVKYSEFGRFCSALNTFQNYVNDSGDHKSDPYWQKFFGYLRRFRFELCAAPILNDYRDNQILEIYGDLANHLKNCSVIYPDFARQASQVMDLLKTLYGDSKNPLLDKLLELSKSRERLVWVIKESRLISQVDDVIHAHLETLGHVEAVHYSQMSDSKCFDAVLVIGSPIWFKDSIFTSPRANEMNIVQYSWMRDSWKLPEPFVAPYTPTRSKHVAYTDDNTSQESEIAAESVLLTFDHEAIATITSRDGHHEFEEIESRCVILEGEQALFVEADNSASILIIDIDEEAEERVKTISLRELKPGLFVLVRTGGGGDYIVPIADQIMGLEGHLARQRQQTWKHLLKKYVFEHGLLKTSIDLLNLGSDIANEINVSNWMFPRNIKTRSKRDFLAIMQLVGLEDQAAEYWNSMEIIDHAHRKAGYQLRKILLDQVDKIASDEFKRRGKIEFKFSETDVIAGLTAFRVEDILSKPYRVSFSRLGVPFRLGD